MTTSTQNTSPDLNTIANWAQSDYTLLTTSFIQAMTPAQLQAMLHPEWVPVTVLAALPAATLNAFTTTQFQALTTDQLNTIPTAVLPSLDNSHIAALTAGQVAAFSHITSLTSAQFGQLNLTAVAATTMAKWSKTNWAGLTAAQVSLFSIAQISSFKSANYLPAAAAAGLLPEQMEPLSSHYAQFSADWFNHVPIASFQALDNSRLSAISAATWAQIDLAHFCALNASQISAINLDFSTVSADWINSLSTATLQGLSATQLGQLSATTIAALSDSNLTAFTATQLAALKDLSLLSVHQFGLLSLPAMSAAQIATWTPEQYATLTTSSFNTLSTAQIGALTNPAALSLSIVSALTVAQVNAINTDFAKLPDAWLNSLSTTALQGLTIWQFSHLSSLTPAEVNNITSIAALSNAQFSQLNLTGVSASVMAGWSQQVWAGLTAGQVSSMNAAQIDSFQHASWLPVSAAAGLLPWQMPLLSSYYSQFSADWFNHLQLASFTALDTSRLNQISASTVARIDAAHLTALSAAQVASMNNLGSMASGKFSLLNISALSESQCAALTMTQYQGLTQTQLSSLSSTQQLALAHPEWLAPGLLNTLSVAQFGSLSAAQFAAMAPGAVSRLDAAHLAVYPGDLTLLSSDTLLAVASRLTDTQRTMLSASQLSQLSLSNSTAQTLINGLSDAGLKNIMQSVASAAGTLFSFDTIESVMKALNSSMTGVMSDTQYADLQSYTQAIGQVRGLDSSIYSLVNSMVNGANGASVNWVNADGSYTRISHLAVGASATQFGQQIAAWLDGTNAPTSSNTQYTDGLALFANGTPTINDIDQGGLGDCSLLAALQTVVNVQPDYIKSMVVQNANGSYSVRFFNGNQPEWVTVDNRTYSDGQEASTASWAAIVERASAAFKSSFKGTDNSYSVVGGGGASELQSVIGDSVTSYTASDYSETEWNTTVFNILKSAVLAGEPTDMGSFQSTKDAVNGKNDFISSHEMAIVAFDEATNNFVITNPWNAAASGSYNGTFEASMDQIWQNGNSNTGIHIGNSTNATGIVGQLITAMATVAPAASATSSLQTDSAAAASPLLAATQGTKIG